MKLRFPHFARASLLLAAAPLIASSFSSPENVEKADKAMKTILTPVAITTQAIVKASGEADARLQATEFFNLKVPTEKLPKQVHLSFEPKIGDILRRDYIRLPLELTYTPLKDLQYTSGITPIIPNPFKYQKNFGFGMLSNELRYDWHPKHLYFETILFGSGIDIPLGKVPIDLINGFTHIKPFVGLSKNLGSEKWRLLIEVNEDVAAKWNHSADDSRKFNVLQYGPAIVFKPNEFSYFAQFALKQYTKTPKSFTGHLVQVGTLWDIPSARTEKWGLPGKWELSVALDSETNEFQESKLGVNTRVRWKFDLKKPKL